MRFYSFKSVVIVASVVVTCGQLCRRPRQKFHHCEFCGRLPFKHAIFREYACQHQILSVAESNERPLTLLDLEKLIHSPEIALI